MPQTSPDAEKTIRELAERYATAWAGRDVDVIMQLHTQNTVFAMHIGSQPSSVGAKDVRAAFVAGLALVPDATFTQRRLHVGADFWVAELTLSGHLANGDPIQIESVDVVTVSDELVARKDTYLDSAAFLTSARENR